MGVAVAVAGSGVEVSVCVGEAVGARVKTAEGVPLGGTFTGGGCATQEERSNGMNGSRKINRLIDVILLLLRELRIGKSSIRS
jgi:hypothetical protein